MHGSFHAYIWSVVIEGHMRGEAESAPIGMRQGAVDVARWDGAGNPAAYWVHINKGANQGMQIARVLEDQTVLGRPLPNHVKRLRLESDSHCRHCIILCSRCGNRKRGDHMERIPDMEEFLGHRCGTPTMVQQNLAAFWCHIPPPNREWEVRQNAFEWARTRK